MSDKHPYTPAQGPIAQTIYQLRKTFPASVTSGTLKKLGIAPNNESRVINVLKYLGIIDQDGAKTSIATKVFSHYDDKNFQIDFGELVKKAYYQLFELHNDGAWELDLGTLINFFRTTDGSTALVGEKQGKTFQALAALAGHGDYQDPKMQHAPKKQSQRAGKIDGHQSPSATSEKQKPNEGGKKDLGLTVRIEINLPADADQSTYDRIFKSIRENLLNE